MKNKPKNATSSVVVERNKIDLVFDLVTMQKGSKAIYPGLKSGTEFNRDEFENWLGGAEKLDDFIVGEFNAKVSQPAWKKVQVEAEFGETVNAILDGKVKAEETSYDLLKRVSVLNKKITKETNIDAKSALILEKETLTADYFELKAKEEAEILAEIS